MLPAFRLGTYSIGRAAESHDQAIVHGPASRLDWLLVGREHLLQVRRAAFEKRWPAAIAVTARLSGP